MENKENKKKKKFEVPDTLVLITFLLALMCILTHLIPAGTYDKEGSKIIAGTFHTLESNPAGILDFFGAYGAGLSKGAGTIFLSLVIGGAFGILTDADTEGTSFEETGKLQPKHIINMILLIAVFAVYCVGSFKKNWQLTELTTCMMVLAILAGIVGRMTPNEISASFVKGAKGMVYTGLMVGFASGINVIMTNANIIHSVIYYLTKPLIGISSTLAAVGMFIVNFIFNIFVTSGSGQCYIVMPIMAPMADLLDVSRQISVSAFQFGDGLCNMILPHSGLMVATLGIAHVPFGKWLKFIGKFCAIVAAAAALFLVAMSLIGWT